MDVKLAESRLKEALEKMHEADEALKRLELISTDQAKQRVKDNATIAWRRVQYTHKAFTDAHLERIGW